MRAVLLITIVTAALGCGGRGTSGPAWPKSAGTEIDPDAEDGGESLDPREAAAVASVESSQEPEPVKPAITEGDKPALVPAAKPDASPATPPAASKPDEPVVEELVIEIND